MEVSKKARGENVWSKVSSLQCPGWLRPGQRRTDHCRWLTETTDEANRTEYVAGLGQKGKKQDAERGEEAGGLLVADTNSCQTPT